MAVDMDFHRHHRVGHDFRQRRAGAAVDGGGGQVQQEIEHARAFLPPEQAVEGPGQLRADAGKAGDFGEIGIEKIGPHDRRKVDDRRAARNRFPGVLSAMPTSHLTAGAARARTGASCAPPRPRGRETETWT